MCLTFHVGRITTEDVMLRWLGERRVPVNAVNGIPVFQRMKMPWSTMRVNWGLGINVQLVKGRRLHFKNSRLSLPWKCYVVESAVARHREGNCMTYSTISCDDKDFCIRVCIRSRLWRPPQMLVGILGESNTCDQLQMYGMLINQWSADISFRFVGTWVGAEVMSKSLFSWLDPWTFSPSL